MSVELFAVATTRPDVVFCDTSFIVDILTDEVSTITTLLGVTKDKLDKAAAATAFFHAYRGYGAQFVSSPYTFAEAGHIIARKIHNDKHGHRSWKEFDRVDSATCQLEFKQTMRLIRYAWRRIAGYDIWFTLPQKGGDLTPYGLRVESEIIEAARLFKKAYMFLDWFDAYHIAMGIASGVEWFATTDRGWKDVTEINVFCDH